MWTVLLRASSLGDLALKLAMRGYSYGDCAGRVLFNTDSSYKSSGNKYTPLNPQPAH